jgi:hypothetical protein
MQYTLKTVFEDFIKFVVITSKNLIIYVFINNVRKLSKIRLIHNGISNYKLFVLRCEKSLQYSSMPVVEISKNQFTVTVTNYAALSLGKDTSL